MTLAPPDKLLHKTCLSLFPFRRNWSPVKQALKYKRKKNFMLLIKASVASPTLNCRKEVGTYKPSLVELLGASASPSTALFCSSHKALLSPLLPTTICQ